MCGSGAEPIWSAWPLRFMTEGFDKFLQECLSQSSNPEKPLFLPDSIPVTVPDMESAEGNLGINLPASYKYFLLRCGSGMWCGEWVAHPSELYAFDSDCLEMEGFVPLVHN